MPSPQAPALLERRFCGENPWRTLSELLAGQKPRLGLAAVLFVVKHSAVGLMPLITANIV